MTEVYIRENSWLAMLAARKLKSKRIAMVIGTTIHLYGVTPKNFINDKKWLQHELKHVAQYRRSGFFPFLAGYIWQSIKNGYHNNKYEIEARNAEKDTFPFEQYKLVLPKT